MKTFILPSLSFLIAAQAMPQNLQCVRGVADYDFWLYLPAMDVMTSNPPVLIFLHGQNLCGSNLKYLTEGKNTGKGKKPPYGAICEIKNRGKEFPAIVVGPQFPEGSRWEPEKLLTVLNYIQKEYNTDEARVYVAGMSAGGFGTLRFAGKYPERVTAAAALCGGGDAEDACNLAKVPLWVMCGTNDSKYFVSQSKAIASAIRQCDGGKFLRFNMLPGHNHSDMEKYFRTTDTLYNWLFSQRKTTNLMASINKKNQKKSISPATISKKTADFYVVSAIAVSKEGKAKAKAAELKKQGYDSGYLWIPDYTSLSGKNLFMVFIGKYSNQKECEEATEKFRKIYPDAFGTKVSQEKESVFIKGVGKVAVTKK